MQSDGPLPQSQVASKSSLRVERVVSLTISPEFAEFWARQGLCFLSGLIWINMD